MMNRRARGHLVNIDIRWLQQMIWTIFTCTYVDTDGYPLRNSFFGIAGLKGPPYRTWCRRPRQSQKHATWFSIFVKHCKTVILNIKIIFNVRDLTYPEDWTIKKVSPMTWHWVPNVSNTRMRNDGRKYWRRRMTSVKRILKIAQSLLRWFNTSEADEEPTEDTYWDFWLPNNADRKLAKLQYAEKL